MSSASGPVALLFPPLQPRHGAPPPSDTAGTRFRVVRRVNMYSWVFKYIILKNHQRQLVRAAHRQHMARAKDVQNDDLTLVWETLSASAIPDDNGEV
jgi:hypothetical protein